MARFEEQDAPSESTFLSKAERKKRAKKIKMIDNLKSQKEAIKNYRPENDRKIKGEPHKTIFVGNMSYKTDDKTLSRQFEAFGKIKRVRVVKDTETGKSKGYGFVEFDEKRSAEIAYSRGDGRRIDEFYVTVDMEKSRIDKYWVPRRLGGGKGGDTRRDREDEAYVKELRRELRAQELEKKQKTQENEVIKV